MFSITISANTVAWYGAILATLSTIKVLYDIWSDKSRLDISFQKDMVILDANANKEMQVLIRVVNKSKRPTQITHWGVRFYKSLDTALVFLNAPTQNLNEQSPSAHYLHPQKDLDLDDLWFVYVVDVRGNEHHLYARRFGFLKWWQYKLRNKLSKWSISKKQPKKTTTNMPKK